MKVNKIGDGMTRVIGYVMIVVALVATLLSGLRVWSMMLLAENGLSRPGAVMELTLLILCGVVIPAGIAALLFKK